MENEIITPNPSQRQMQITASKDYLQKINWAMGYPEMLIQRFVAMFGEEPTLRELCFSRENVTNRDMGIPAAWLNHNLPRHFVPICAHHSREYETLPHRGEIYDTSIEEPLYYGIKSYWGTHQLSIWASWESKMLIGLTASGSLGVVFNMLDAESFYLWKTIRKDFASQCLHKILKQNVEKVQ